MATGKRVNDLFANTKELPNDIKKEEMNSIQTANPEQAPQKRIGRKPAAEPYEKITICMPLRQVVLLDKACVNILEKTGRHVRRTELVRALIEQAASSLDVDSAGFIKTVSKLLANR